MASQFERQVLGGLSVLAAVGAETGLLIVNRFLLLGKSPGLLIIVLADYIEQIAFSSKPAFADFMQGGDID